ncbi:MAG: SDR family NAD(P)-dependent oxidoreductase [Paludibacteraceae bacterium]|nr:SDR family NAD(P)-dependent oxidoreductase [Paludibacteraceae bacterium]MBR5973279.1 SDR family NAD(P)-dependent oxidoreductase [Paludibacteraceae bacterium]
MYALVTGASSGIGLQYATELARQKYDLLLVSNQEKEIQEAATDLANRFGVQTIGLYKDLSTENAAQELHTYCKENNLQIDILINNAGIFFFNEYVKTDIKRIELMLNLHMKTVSEMCYYFGADMKERGFGYILNMSSMSAWMTMPGISVYNATKAYILNFSRSIWYEMKPYGVGVTAICPGAVDTGLYGLSDKWRKVAVGIGVSMRPEELAKKALKKMFKKKKQYIPGWINHIFIFLVKHLPDWFIFLMIKRIEQFQK